MHNSVTLKYGVRLPSHHLWPQHIEPFVNLTADCHLTLAKSHQYLYEDRMFIEKETWRLLKEEIIEQSNSPWQAEVVVVKDYNKKRCLATDYSETINNFTLLNGYPSAPY